MREDEDATTPRGEAIRRVGAPSGPERMRREIRRSRQDEIRTETETETETAIATDDGVGTVEDGTTETIEEAGVDDTNRTAATTDGTETTETTEDAIDANK